MSKIIIVKGSPNKVCVSFELEQNLSKSIGYVQTDLSIYDFYSNDIKLCELLLTQKFILFYDRTIIANLIIKLKKTQSTNLLKIMYNYIEMYYDYISLKLLDTKIYDVTQKYAVDESSPIRCFVNKFIPTFNLKYYIVWDKIMIIHNNVPIVIRFIEKYDCDDINNMKKYCIYVDNNEKFIINQHTFANHHGIPTIFNLNNLIDVKLTNLSIDNKNGISLVCTKNNDTMFFENIIQIHIINKHLKIIIILGYTTLNNMYLLQCDAKSKNIITKFNNLMSVCYNNNDNIIDNPTLYTLRYNNEYNHVKLYKYDYISATTKISDLNNKIKKNETYDLSECYNIHNTIPSTNSNDNLIFLHNKYIIFHDKINKMYHIYNFIENIYIQSLKIKKHEILFTQGGLAPYTPPFAPGLKLGRQGGEYFLLNDILYKLDNNSITEIFQANYNLDAIPHIIEYVIGKYIIIYYTVSLLPDEKRKSTDSDINHYLYISNNQNKTVHILIKNKISNILVKNDILILYYENIYDINKFDHNSIKYSKISISNIVEFNL